MCYKSLTVDNTNLVPYCFGEKKFFLAPKCPKLGYMKLLLFLLVLLSLRMAVSAQPSFPALTVSHLTGNIYVFTTYVDHFPANRLYLVTGKGVVMIDGDRGAGVPA